MELSQFTDYSLRVLLYAGAHDGLASVRGVSESFGVSRNHLVKVVHKLSQLGYLKTRRGRGGGFELGMPPEEIVLGQLVRQTENLALVECLRPDGGNCRIVCSCKLKGALFRARKAFLDELDRHSLADLLSSKDEMRRDLSTGQLAKEEK